ncbi:TetR/AcrR family transcriptional regulator [Microterricola gilva]|uniref:TetR/AcrR family transcriptional regulator n=1 Tax=Microterricola gilva TaxID=393267 RepID=UPI0013EE74F2|nr:TetR/AcrR family transcriptional regulator [Microterricola gilva]
MSSPRSAGRPRISVLSAEQIIDAAFDLVRTAGPSGFTMAGLARALSVQPPALYHYFAGKDEVVRAMRGRIADMIDVSGFTAGPAERSPGAFSDAVLRWAHSYREAFLSYPAGIALLATTAIDGQERSVANYEAMTVAFLGDGWPEAMIVDAIVVMESYILGSALDALAPEDIMSPGASAAGAPHFARAEGLRTRNAAERGIRTSDQAFSLGIGALLTGLRSTAGLA